MYSELLTLLKNCSGRIATAESCTGGLVAAALTDIPGISEVFAGGVVAYENEVKNRLLDVPMSVFETVGAVSEECAHFMAAGAAALRLIEKEMPYAGLEAKAKMLSGAVSEAAKKKGIPLQCPIAASLMAFFFNERRVDNLDIAMRSSRELYKKFFFGCLERGVYIAPSPFEILFVSAAHTAQDMEFAAEAMSAAIAAL